MGWKASRSFAFPISFKAFCLEADIEVYALARPRRIMALGTLPPSLLVAADANFFEAENEESEIVSRMLYLFVFPFRSFSFFAFDCEKFLSF